MLPLTRRFEIPLDVVDLEMDWLMDRMIGGGEVPENLAPYAVDIEEDANCIYVEAELPGFKKEEIDVTLEDGVLTIRAERKSEKKIKERHPLQIERTWTHFQRSFSLPAVVKEDTIKAQLEEGVLKIALERREDAKPHKVRIALGDGPPTSVENQGEKKQ